MSNNKQERIAQLLLQLEEKYSATGQDITAYLEGLLYTDYLAYWDYIHLDTLLTLQNPKTRIPDEEIFIMYHQVTELYFKMILNECRQIADRENLDAAFFTERLGRINRYFAILADSFGVMTDGMEPAQFLQFRMALLPASGFQSAQYRKVELCSTPMYFLVAYDQREKFTQNSPVEDMFQYIYWRNGATELSTGKKTLTLRQFEEKYDNDLLKTAREYQHKNLWLRYQELPEALRNDEKLIAALRQLDLNVNVNWPLQHYKTAARYLQRDPSDIAATGGTNWQKYLPPRFQRRIFFPSLWNEEELGEWGKPRS